MEFESYWKKKNNFITFPFDLDYVLIYRINIQIDSCFVGNYDIVLWLDNNCISQFTQHRELASLSPCTPNRVIFYS